MGKTPRNAPLTLPGNEKRGVGEGEGEGFRLYRKGRGIQPACLPAYFTIFIAKTEKLFAKLNFN